MSQDKLVYSGLPNLDKFWYAFALKEICMPFSTFSCWHFATTQNAMVAKFLSGVKYHSLGQIALSGSKLLIDHGINHKSHQHLVNLYIWSLTYLVMWPKYSLSGGKFLKSPSYQLEISDISLWQHVFGSYLRIFHPNNTFQLWCWYVLYYNYLVCYPTTFFTYVAKFLLSLNKYSC